jgi:ABC-type multidrug transport system permease subunit
MSPIHHLSAYVLAKNLVDAAIQLSRPIVFSVIVYFMVGFQMDVGKFFIFMLFMTLASLTATSLALTVSTFARTTTMSVTILPIVLELCRLYGGFFLSPAKLPKYFVWLDALSYIKYVYVGISLNEMQGIDLTCSLADKSKCVTGQCRITELGLDYITIG